MKPLEELRVAGIPTEQIDDKESVVSKSDILSYLNKKIAELDHRLPHGDDFIVAKAARCIVLTQAVYGVGTQDAGSRVADWCVRKLPPFGTRLESTPPEQFAMYCKHTVDGITESMDIILRATLWINETKRLLAIDKVAKEQINGHFDYVNGRYIEYDPMEIEAWAHLNKAKHSGQRLEEEKDITVDVLRLAISTSLGIRKEAATSLVENGYLLPSAVLEAPIEDLEKIARVGPSTISRLKEVKGEQ